MNLSRTPINANQPPSPLKVVVFPDTLGSMRQCKVCAHPDRAAIEDALLRRTATVRIGEQFGVSQWSVVRHSKHLSRSVICSGPTPLLDRIEALTVRLESIVGHAESGKDWRCAVMAVREMRETLELVARLTGAMPSAGQGTRVAVAVNVTTGHPTSSLNDMDLDVQIAASVAEATDNFNAQTIERMKRLVARNRPALLMAGTQGNGDISGTRNSEQAEVVESESI